MADLDALEKSHHLPSGENIPWRDEEEIIPYDIYTACSLGEHNFVRELLSEGMKKAEMNKHNCGGWTALMYAAYVGHDNVVNLLLDVDVDVNIKALKSGSTPLMLAASCGNESVVYFLLQSGADIDAQDNQGWTALYYATHQGHLNVVKLLIENGANKELKEVKYCLTPLLDAAKEGHEMIFKVILESGANATARTSQGETLRQLALRHGNISIVNVLDQQICKRVPDVMLRSEPGLFGIDMGGDDFPSQKGHYEWLGYHDNGIPHAGVQHGPEVFAKLLNQSKDAGYQPSCSLPALTPTCTVQVSTPQPIPGGSPRLTPDTQTPVGSIGSPEDCNYFFNTGCSTMRNLHLHNRLKRPSVEGRSPRAASPVSQGLVQRRESESSTPELPSLASFLEGLKLEKYIPVFEQQNFDFEDFLSLNDVELKEIGIKLLGPRKKMISAINRWKSENRTLARNQLQAYHVKLTQERELMQEFLQNEKAVREQLYDMAKGAQFELLKAASSMATLRSLTENILDRLSSDDNLKETGAKLGSVVENTTENISQALRRVERILKGNVTALQQSPDSSELSGFSLNGF